MFIAIAHEIHDPPTFQKCSEEVFPLPDGVHLHLLQERPGQCVALNKQCLFPLCEGRKA